MLGEYGLWHGSSTGCRAAHWLAQGLGAPAPQGRRVQGAALHTRSCAQASGKSRHGCCSKWHCCQALLFQGRLHCVLKSSRGVHCMAASDGPLGCSMQTLQGAEPWPSPLGRQQAVQCTRANGIAFPFRMTPMLHHCTAHAMRLSFTSFQACTRPLHWVAARLIQIDVSILPEPQSLPQTFLGTYGTISAEMRSTTEDVTWKSSQERLACRTSTCLAGSGMPRRRISVIGSASLHSAHRYVSPCRCRTHPLQAQHCSHADASHVMLTQHRQLLDLHPKHAWPAHRLTGYTPGYASRSNVRHAARPTTSCRGKV